MIPTNKFLLTYKTEDPDEPKEEYKQVLKVKGYYAEALEKANNFLNSCYYSWLIIDLKRI